MSKAYTQAASSISVAACIRCGKPAIGCALQDNCFAEKYCAECLMALLVVAK